MSRLVPIAWLGIIPFIGGCALLGAYPYADRSNPTQVINPSEVQRPVEPSVPPLDDVCQVISVRRLTRALWRQVETSGSAALIDGRYLITAAHNVADYPAGNRMSQIRVSCNARDVTSETVDVTLDRRAIESRVSIPRYAWRAHHRDRKYEFDYAFIDLQESLASANRFSLDPDVVPRVGETLFIGGYPGGVISNQRTLHAGSGKVVGIDGNLITYDIETANGNSGGPLWVVRDGRMYVVAVHVNYSTGRLLNAGFHEEWARWRTPRGTNPRGTNPPGFVSSANQKSS